MTRPGPPPKPTRLKILSGNPGKRVLNVNEPKFAPAKSAKAPERLPKRAQILWQRIAAQLEANGLLTAVDLESLYIYCNSWAQYMDCQNFLNKNGTSYEITTTTGEINTRMYPHVAAQVNYAKLMDRMASKLGLTPADRTRIHATDASTSEPDSLEEIFKRRECRQ